MSEKRSIAWIEDDIDVLLPLMRPLGKQGFEILKYYSYTEALEHLDEIRECELICLDLILPPGHGAEPQPETEYLGLKLLREFRALYGLTMPILVLSVIADGPDVDQEELRRLDAASLAKPVHLHELRAEVDELLGLRDN